PAEAALAVYILRLDDECVALPGATRRAQPQRDVRRRMRPAVDPDDAGVVNHLGQDDHAIAELQNLDEVVVRSDLNRRPRIERQTALLQRAVLRTVRR